MLNKFFDFLKGYVIIEISGKNYERFLNICLRRKIPIRTTKPCKNGVILSINRSDFKKLHSVFRICDVRIRILKKCGIYHLIRKYRHRYVFLLCAVMSVVLLFITSSYIWTVTIDGAKPEEISMLYTMLRDNGVYPGAKKSDIKDLYAIKNNIINHTDDIAWLWVYIDGTKAQVKVLNRRVVDNMIDKSIACNIVATTDGVIKNMTVKQGEAKLKEGDAVIKGDTLISGKVSAYREGYDENYMYVHALGEVYAYTVHTKTARQKLYDTVSVPTKNHKRYYTLELFGKKYNLYRNKNIGYESYDVKNTAYELKLPIIGYVGIGLFCENNIETNIIKNPISEELAFDIAKENLEQEICKSLNIKSQKLDEKADYTKISDDEIEVECTISFIENIGTKEPIRSEEIEQYRDTDATEP